MFAVHTLPFPKGQGLQGILLTQQAFANQLGSWGSDFITLAILLFGFTSIVANFAYADNNLKYLKLDHAGGHWFLRIGFLAMLVFGSVASLPQVIALADLATGLMTVVNVIALFLLSKVVLVITRDYHQQLKQKKVPCYQASKQQQQAFNLTKKIWSE